MPNLSFFEDLFSLFQLAVLLLVSLTVKRISSSDTPATDSCKEKLLIALHNSLLFCLTYGSRTFWCLMRNGSDVCWTFPPLELWK